MLTLGPLSWEGKKKISLSTASSRRLPDPTAGAEGSTWVTQVPSGVPLGRLGAQDSSGRPVARGRTGVTCSWMHLRFISRVSQNSNSTRGRGCSPSSRAWAESLLSTSRIWRDQSMMTVSMACSSELSREEGILPGRVGGRGCQPGETLHQHCVLPGMPVPPRKRVRRASSGIKSTFMKAPPAVLTGVTMGRVLGA